MKIPKIYGFNKSSEAGLNVFSPSIFLGGCNLRCPYCMNSKLIKPDSIQTVDTQMVKDYVLEDKSEMIMISGGEPLCSKLDELMNLFNEIKSWGCKIGMSTNGTKSDNLRMVIPYLSYVALDMKSSSLEIYEQIGDGNSLWANMLLSKFILKMKKKKKGEDFNYEIRTTLYPPFVDKEGIKEMAKNIWEGETWILQKFRYANNMLDPSCNEIKLYTDDEIEELFKIAKSHVENVYLRDV